MEKKKRFFFNFSQLHLYESMAQVTVIKVLIIMIKVSCKQSEN